MITVCLLVYCIYIITCTTCILFEANYLPNSDYYTSSGLPYNVHSTDSMIDNNINIHPYKQCNKDLNPHRLSTMRTKEHCILHMALINEKQGQQRKDRQTKYGLYTECNPLFRLSVDLYRYFGCVQQTSMIAGHLFQKIICINTKCISTTTILSPLAP